MCHSYLRLLAGLILIICNLYACGAGASKATVWEFRNAKTGIASNERVFIILNSYLVYGKNEETEEKEKEIENCINEAINGEDSKFTVISAKEFRASVLQGGEGYKDSPRSPETFLSFLGNEKSSQATVERGIRYLVIVDLKTDYSSGDWHFYHDGVEHSRIRSSVFEAVILDATYHSNSGTIISSSSGKVGLGVGCLPSLPIPIPLPRYAQTETEACSGLGKAIAKFIADK